MKLLDLAKDLAAIAGWNITGTDSQAMADKAKALRRINIIRSDIASRFAGRWQSQYREGWLPLVPVYSDGTVALTRGSRTVTGTSTTFTSAMVGRKFLGPDNAYYKIAGYTSATVITLSQPYQGADDAAASYQIWKDEYVLSPDVYSIVDFINYTLPMQMVEDTNKHGRMNKPRATATEEQKYFSVLRRANKASYSTGTISGTINTNVITGAGTSWLDNLEPGFEIQVTVGTTAYVYHVESVDSDTQITIKEYVAATIAALTTYSALGKNALVVRFIAPSAQAIVSYGYFSKIYALVSDNDEDWILELYSHVVSDGASKYNFLDKNDPVRAQIAAQMYENSISNAHMSDASQFGGVSVVGLDIPSSARED